MSDKLVSFIMSAYNSEISVGNAIESILSQSYSNINLHIIDDASSDKTRKIIETYASTHDNVYAYNNKKNIGLTKSLNKLIRNADGFYLARQDADDISLKTRIEEQVDFLEKNKLDACSTRAFITGTKKVTPSKSFYLPKKIVMRIKNPFIHGTLLIKKSILEKVGNYDESFYYSQDYKLMKDLMVNKFKVKILKQPLYYLNMKGNISVNNKIEQQYYADCVRNNQIPNDLPLS